MSKSQLHPECIMAYCNFSLVASLIDRLLELFLVYKDIGTYQVMGVGKDFPTICKLLTKAVYAFSWAEGIRPPWPVPPPAVVFASVATNT